MLPRHNDRTLPSRIFSATHRRLHYLLLVALIALSLAFVPWHKIVKGASPIDPETGIDHVDMVFRGNAKQAIDLLLTGFEFEQKMGWDYLMEHPAETQLLAREIEQEIFSQPVDLGYKPFYPPFGPQKRRIEVLDSLERQNPSGAMADLVKKLLGKLEAAPATASPEVRDSVAKRWRGDRDDEDDPYRNHTLTWLLQQFPRDEAVERWGARLRALKSRRTEWQREVVLAVDVLRFELAGELATGVARMKEIASVRSEADRTLAIEQVFFSTDHQRLWSYSLGAVLGRWDPVTMKLIDFHMPPQGYGLFSVAQPGGQFGLFLPNSLFDRKGLQDYPPAEPVVATWITAESGELKSMELTLSARSKTRWLRDGQLLVTSDKTLSLVDLDRGQILTQVTAENISTPYYASMDRRFFLVGSCWKGHHIVHDRVDLKLADVTRLPSYPKADRVSIDGVDYERLDDTETFSVYPLTPLLPEALPNLRGLHVWKIVQSADRRRLAILASDVSNVRGQYDHPRPRTPITVRIYDATSLRMIGAIEAASPVNACLSPDGSQLVLIHAGESLERWPLPE